MVGANGSKSTGDHWRWWIRRRILQTLQTLLWTKDVARLISKRDQRRQLPPFQPSVNINLGYGFPLIWIKNQFSRYFNPYYKRETATSQNRTFLLVSIDYQFQAALWSIGALGNLWKKFAVPYYDYTSQTSGTPEFLQVEWKLGVLC